MNISKLLARKSRQAERKITILREVETAGSMHGSDADNDGYRSISRACYYNHCHGSASGFQKRWDCIGLREFLFEII